MKSHITFEIDGKVASTRPGASVDMNMQNPLFNAVEAFSYPVELPLARNRELLGNVEVPQSDLRPIDIDDKPAIIKSDGIPVASGVVLTDSDYEVKDSIAISINSERKSFKDLISELNCNDIDLLPGDEIVIGEKIGQVKMTGTIVTTITTKTTYMEFVGGNPHEGGGGYRRNGTTTETEEVSKNVELYLDLPAIAYSYPAKCVDAGGGIAEVESTKHYTSPSHDVNVPKIVTSYINTSMPFDAQHPYCNARVCYKHYGMEEKDGVISTSSDISSEKATEFEAVWPYWVLDAKRPQSGICFYVMYFLRCLFAHLGIAYNDDELYAVEDMRRLCFFTTKCAFYEKTLVANNFHGNQTDFSNHVNAWSSSRGLGGTMEIEKNLDMTRYVTREGGGDEDRDYTTIVKTYAINEERSNLQFSADLNEMIATRDNFPEESVTSVIESLENSFGIRFIFDRFNTTCKAVFIRDVFRDQRSPIKFLGNVLSVHKVMDKTTGVKVCYSSESDAKEQKEIVRKGVRQYDTDYDYTDYPPENQNHGIISGKPQTVTNKRYKDFFAKLSSSDMTCYIDKVTGNAYRIKIDGDAQEANEWHPVLFEVGGYKGVEIGDCSETNEDNMVSLVSNFVPVLFNDVNYLQETEQEDPQSLFAAFIDEDMEHEFVEHQLMSVSEFENGKVQLKVRLKTIESYDPTKTDDGNSPLQHIEWGLAVAMMRGGGATAKILDYDFGYDGFNNDKWQLLSGKDYQMFNDTMTHFAQKFDYNGEQSGDGSGERFSLKMRAYKQPEWADAPLFSGSTADQNRGLFDTFMAEYAYFLLKRKTFRIEALCTAAELADIPNNWTRRYSIDGHVGYINKFSYSISDEQGIGKVTFDFYAL